MTNIQHIKKKRITIPLIKGYLCFLVFFIALCFSERLKEGIIFGFRICFFNIIPTLFPFFILSDLWISVIYYKNNSLPARCLKKLFHVNGEGLSSFVIGNVCGFPLGIKTASKKYSLGIINKDELETLITISNNPSVAFVVSGIGLGLFHDIKLGLVLYFSVLISSIITGAFFRSAEEKPQKAYEISKQKFNIIESVRSAGLSSLYVSFYIIFFSGIIGVISSLIKNELAISIISAFLEVASACSIISENRQILGSFCLPLISFSLAFSGLSVFLQAFSILPPTISKKKYLFKKLLQGIISSIITLLLLYVI